MSDDDKQPPKPPAPMKKTSAVPLKKETVRVTLKADPAPTAPSSEAPKPPAPAPTIPLKTAAPSTGAPAPAPTIPLKTGGGSTVALDTAPKPAGTQPLPQATVQLQNTQPLGTPTAPTTPQIGTINTTNVDDDDEESDTIPTIMSILAFVFTLGVLILALMTWTKENEIGDLFS